MNPSLFIGVDGGASKCNVRIEDEAGRLLGHGSGGPANIRLSVEGAWQSLLEGLNEALQAAGLEKPNHTWQLHVGVGIAGSEIHEAYEQFIKTPHPFKTLNVVSDAYTACLGAHGGKDGAIIVIGTGVVGFQIEAGKSKQVGGYGFPYDDEGSGAWLGLETVRETLYSLDGRRLPTSLTKMIAARFNNDAKQLANWANQARTTDFASLAPEVIHCSKQGDALAIQLLTQAAAAINLVAHAQNPKLPCALVGGLASFIEPYLDKALQSRLKKCSETPEQGAIRLVKMLRTS